MTPLLGLELYPAKRYVRYPGSIDENGIWIIVEELGNTMDPYTRTQELLKDRGSRP